MVYFVSEVGNSHCARLLRISKRSVQSFYDKLRQKWIDDINRNPVVLSSRGEHEVDEVYIKRITTPAGEVVNK